MRTLTHAALWAVLCALTTPAAARTVVECVEADGTVTFRDSCPPEMTVKSVRELRGVGPAGPHVAAAAAAFPIVVYTVPDCDACDLVRNALAGRHFPFREIDVQDDAARQEALRSRTGGLTVPAVLIGDQVLTGYSRDALDAALVRAGYPVEGLPAGTAVPPPADTEAEFEQPPASPDATDADGDADQVDDTLE